MSQSKQSWHPLLNGLQRQRALSVIKEIIAALPELPEPASAELTDASLASGAAGLATLCAYLSRAGFDYDENAAEFLSHAINAISTSPMGVSFYGGFTGIAWATEHLHEQLLEADGEDANEAIDEALIAYLDRSPWDDDFDLVSGLVGIGVYALERLPRASAVECLSLIVDRLDETAERRADGLTWLTRPHLLPERQRKQCPDGYYNLGLAHGVPGVVALLGQICAAGMGVDKARPLLDGAVAWVLLQQSGAGTQSCFPPWIRLSRLEREDCRLAWCYGDAGVAAALFLAARSVREAKWEREALAIARRAAARVPETAGVKDAGLCHGAAGLAHIFNRLFQATGDESLREAALYWFQRVLELRIEGQGIAGFSAYWPIVDGQEEHWEDEVGILVGASGVALSLLAAATDVEPEWDRMLLISIPRI
jgi:lantibiotic biosynthesis protein